MSKNVAVFVDVANIFYAAKAAGVDIDYVTLLKASSAGRDLVRAYAYTGLDPENENQRNFHEFLRRHGYKVVSKDIRKYGDGKVKANLDIELVVDMMKTARNLDVAIVVSGDGDFAPAIRAVQEMGVRVEVVSFRGNTSSDLIDVADIFTDITQIAKVEKGSSRSGRRVATDDEDLSMTEVPDKMTEGTGDGRRRGRGSRSRTGEAAATGTARPRTAARAASTRAPSARTLAARAAAAQDAVVLEGTLVALPGEKLSRARRAPAPEPVEGVELDELPVTDAIEPIDAGESEIDVEGAEGVGGDVAADADGQPGDGQHRRRRRRGGRGRGRGHGREGQGVPVEGTPDGDVEEFEEPEPLPAPRRPAFSFGSVWDSQLGKAPPAAAPGSGTTSIPDEEDLEEPSIPEYLLAERRNRDAGRNRPGRGGVGSRRGGAYAAALDRERFGGGRGSTQSRFAEPAQRHRDIGAGRSDPGRRPPGRGYERPEPRSSGGEPWSEVPPEIEAMLRAQLAGSGRAARPVAGGERRPPITAGAGEAPAAQAGPAAPVAGPRPTARTRVPARGRRATVAAPLADANAAATGAVVSDEAATDTAASKAAASPPARPASRARRAPKAAPVATADRSTAEAAGPPATSPRRGRSAGRTAAVEPGSDAATGAAGGEAEASAPKRRITRRKTTAAD